MKMETVSTAIIYLTHHRRILSGCGIAAHRTILSPASPRSGRQHKAWGVSPRIASGKVKQARGAGGSLIIWKTFRRDRYRPLRGLDYFCFFILGLTPQALCCRPLRGLKLIVARFLWLPLAKHHRIGPCCVKYVIALLLARLVASFCVSGTRQPQLDSASSS
jgi:hypothetical protein